MTLTKDSVETFVTDYVGAFSDCGKDSSPEKWEDLMDKYHKQDSCYIRPSGNPMTREIFLEMTSGGDITNSRQDLIAVNSVNIIGNGKVACVVYTANEFFTHKGTPNEDRVVASLIIEEMDDGTMKIAHGHRCTGVPIPDDD